MNNEIAKDAILDAIENRRLVAQPHDAGLDEALKIINTSITEYPDVQRLIVQVQQLSAENKRLREALIEYGSHSETCESHHSDRNTMGMGLTKRQCNCGFSQALKG